MAELVDQPIPDSWTPDARESEMRYRAERSVALLVISHGNDQQLTRCVDSIGEMLFPRWGAFEELWICDASATSCTIAEIGTKFILRVDDRFTFNNHIHVDAMARILTRNAHLAQIALWCDDSTDGIQHNQCMAKVGEPDPRSGVDGLAWIEHQIKPSGNPSLSWRDVYQPRNTYAYFGYPNSGVTMTTALEH